MPAFNPDDPRYVYAGCYMGIISEYDMQTGAARDVMAFPQMPAADPAARHEVPLQLERARSSCRRPIRTVIYHGANVLLRSDDRGTTWREVSPDLTRNDKSKQGPGGAPITNEGAGGEIYGTIFTIAESPHDAKTIWVGTDDGIRAADARRRARRGRT